MRLRSLFNQTLNDDFCEQAGSQQRFMKKKKSKQIIQQHYIYWVTFYEDAVPTF